MKIKERNGFGLILAMLMAFIIVLYPVQANSMDSETKDMCNKVIMKIFNNIVSQKSQFKELGDFGNANLSINPYGIYTFRYKFKDITQVSKNKDFEFGLTMASLNNTNQAFGSTPSTFDLGFPLLDLRFSGYQHNTQGTRKFDLQSLVQNYGQELWDYQQKYMPYQLELTPVKAEYKVGENIDFKVILTNRSEKNFMIKDLSANTLYFLYNNKTWGAQEVNPAQVEDKQIFLKSGESVEKIFRGPPILAAQEFEIYVSYGLTYQGVKASDALKVKVIQ